MKNCERAKTIIPLAATGNAATSRGNRTACSQTGLTQITEPLFQSLAKLPELLLKPVNRRRCALKAFLKPAFDSPNERLRPPFPVRLSDKKRDRAADHQPEYKQPNQHRRLVLLPAHVGLDII